MKIGFTGTHLIGFPGKTVQALAFRTTMFELDPTEFHHGDCLGWDKLANDLIREWLPKCKVVIHPPIKPDMRAWCSTEFENMRPQKEYLERNYDIVNESEVLIACPKRKVEELRSGTWATVRYARKKRKPIYIIQPFGHIIRENV
jgi:hypothetical protein